MDNKDHPRLRIKLDHQEIDMTRQNSALYLFMGKTAMYDHIFVHDHEHERVGYLFKNMEKYAEYGKFMLRYQFPLHQYLQENDLVEMDLRAYKVVQDELDKPKPPMTIVFPSGWEGFLGHEPQKE
jgi:hypothetical protein